MVKLKRTRTARMARGWTPVTKTHILNFHTLESIYTIPLIELDY